MSQLNPTDTEATKLAQEYILHGDQVRAWRIVYPDSEAGLDTQYAKSSAAFDNDKVKIRIEELNKISKDNSEKEFTFTVSKLKKILDSVIQKGLGGKDSEEFNLNLSAVVAAVKEVNSMDGNHNDPKLNLTIVTDSGKHVW